ncbi:MAG: AMP-binding protein [Microbacteriaceae bacterium]|nr:AMP-binding protein [Microbacteriaceae bacterium]
MILRAAPGSTIAAAGSLLTRSGLLRHAGAAAALRRGGIAAVTGLAALRSPGRPVLVREHDALTGLELDAAVRATATALAAEWPAGARIGVRGDGGIATLVALAAAGAAGLDAVPLGPRLGSEDLAALTAGLDGVVDDWDAVRRDDRTPPGQGRRQGRAGRTAAPPPRPRPPPRATGRVHLLIPKQQTFHHGSPRRRLGVRGMLQLADADRRLRIPLGAVLVLAPLDHGHGLTAALAGLARGRTALLGGGLRPAEQAELALRHRPATITGVPAQLARLLDAADAAFDGVRLVVSGSSRLDPGLRARLAATGARVLDCYGTTETGTVAIEGRPLAGVRIAVEAGGGIRIASPLGGRAWRVPGDLGRVERGRLVIEGRTGALVDSGGELVSPERVAAALTAIPGVVSARVVAVPDDLKGTTLHAEVTTTDPALDADALRRELAARLGRSGVPTRLIVAREG